MRLILSLLLATLLHAADPSKAQRKADDMKRKTETTKSDKWRKLKREITVIERDRAASCALDGKGLGQDALGDLICVQVPPAKPPEVVHENTPITAK